MAVNAGFKATERSWAPFRVPLAAKSVSPVDDQLNVLTFAPRATATRCNR